MLFIKLCDWYVVQVQKTSEIRLKHLTTACDEVTKFEEELGKFEEWLTMSSKELDRQEELIRDLDNFSRVMEQQKVGAKGGHLKQWRQVFVRTSEKYEMALHVKSLLFYIDVLKWVCLI